MRNPVPRLNSPLLASPHMASAALYDASVDASASAVKFAGVLPADWTSPAAQQYQRRVSALAAVTERFAQSLLTARGAAWAHEQEIAATRAALTGAQVAQ